MQVKELLEFIEARRKEGYDIDNFNIQYSETTDERRTNEYEIEDVTIQYDNIITLI